MTHNVFRLMHGVPTLQWDDGIARSAQQWADRCVFEHSGGPFGENLALGHESIRAATEDWYKEIELYDFNRPGFSAATGHFTQVVWANSRRLGCALGNCPGKPNLFVCQYDPPGNFNNDYAENVPRPVINAA